MLNATKKPRALPNLAAIGFFILVIPVLAAITVSLWLTATALYENVKFARTTDQMLGLISAARDAAAKNPAFGQQQNEDIMEELIRLGQYAARPSNAWSGAIRATLTGSPSLMRIETDFPARSCRRFANYFGKEANNVALQKMEAREEYSGWRLFYNASANAVAPGSMAINAACGNSQNTTLALTVRLR